MITGMMDKNSNVEKVLAKHKIKEINIKKAIELGIPTSEIHRLINWAKMNNTYYYIKQGRGLNEFLGEIIANELNLKTAHYEPVDYYGDFYIRTPNFREKDKTYHRVSKFTTQEGDKLDYFKEFKTYEQLKQDMLKLYALDIYMMQLDRADVNIQLEKKDDSLRLAPVFDYSAAYMCSHKRYLEYYNYMYSMNIEKMDEVFNKYPELYNYLKQLDNVDFLKLLKREMEKYKLNFTSTINNFYEESFSESHKLLQKIMI